MARSRVVVVGAGICGLTAAWRLALQGQAVTLVDPALAAGADPTQAGSPAALGLLLAQVFQRSGGRAWRLRQQSQALWDTWLPQLAARGHRLPRRRGLLLLAASDHDLQRQAQIAADRARQGIPMRCLHPAELEPLQPRLPGPALGGLLSPRDGQVDPGPLLAALLAEVRRAGAPCLADTAVALERGRPWRLLLAGGERLAAEQVVLTLGLGTASLLVGLGHQLALEPVLGQALELELAMDPDWTWPGAVVWRGINLVPRPDLAGSGRRLWLGATLEPGTRASGEALRQLQELEGAAPDWLRAAAVVRHWQGLRCRPQGQPAPVLAEPEPGLLIATGHYRNGVLLAPATAAWLCERIAAA